MLTEMPAKRTALGLLPVASVRRPNLVYRRIKAVSYTHLDVYKRQSKRGIIRKTAIQKMGSAGALADILYIVVPCYNEEAVLPETSRRLRAKMEAMVSSGRISERSRVLLVNDGSKDGT